MVNKKYNKVLTVILIIVVIVIFALLGFWGYETFKKYYQEQDIDKALNEFDNSVIISGPTVPNNNTNIEIGNYTPVSNEVIYGNQGSGTTTYKGFTVVGKIEIPAIDLEYPILERATKSSLEASVGVLLGPGLNQVGNTVIVGHNYRNSTFFSRNKELKNGDKVYITDTTGTRLEYTIYNVYTTSAEDTAYITRDTAGKREISLSTCTDDSRYRLIVWAREGSE